MKYLKAIKIGIFCFLLFTCNLVLAQDYFRMSADFSTKIKKADGTLSLTKGRVYYDKYTRELIYDVTFPDKEKWVIQKSKIYKLKHDSVYMTEDMPSVSEFTIFHLALNSNLTYFGLNNEKFSIGKVEKQGDLVISYWDIPKQAQSMISNIAIAKKGNSLYGIVIYGADNRILSKQFFENYIKIGGFEFPGKVVQFFYDKDQNKNYQVMEFKNIVLNDTQHEELYHYKPNL